MKVAAYVRPWSIGYFQYLLPRAFPGAKTLYLSDFRGLGDFSLSDLFHRNLQGTDEKYHSPEWLTLAVELDVIARNYLLRSMPLEKSRRFVRAMSRAIGEMLDELLPDAVISPTGDSYVMDLLVRHARARGIPYAGLLPCPFPGFTRVTAIGEYASFRHVPESECDSAIAAIKDPDFKTLDLKDWLAMYGSSLVHLKRPLREMPKRYWFPLLSRIRGEPMNYHYLSSGLSSVSFISQALLVSRYFDRKWSARLDSWTGSTAFLPLQAFPECTTDYHVKEIDLIDFPRLLPRMLELLRSVPGVLVCIKEHPGMIGARPPGFYDMLCSFPNVLMVPSEVPASTLISACDLTVVWTGTAGLEAAIRGKPVITFGRPYYLKGPSFRGVLTLEQFGDLPRTVSELATVGSEHTPPAEVARHVLSGCFPGEFRFINFSSDNEQLRRDADRMAEGVGSNWADWATAPKDNVS